MLEEMNRHSGLIEIFARVRRKDIAYVKFLIESYEAIGFMRTVDETDGIVILCFVPDFSDSSRALVSALEGEIGLERVPRPEGVSETWLLDSLAV